MELTVILYMFELINKYSKISDLNYIIRCLILIPLNRRPEISC